jgi:hypothetical protein
MKRMQNSKPHLESRLKRLFYVQFVYSSGVNALPSGPIATSNACVVPSCSFGGYLFVMMAKSWREYAVLHAYAPKQNSLLGIASDKKSLVKPSGVRPPNITTSPPFKNEVCPTLRLTTSFSTLDHVHVAVSKR